MAVAYTKLLAVLALLLAEGASARSELRQRQLQRGQSDLSVDSTANSTLASPSFVLSEPQAVVHLLVICNAYAHVKPLNVFRRSASEKLTGDKPLNYKECREFTLPLEGKERLEFRLDSMLVGTFDTNKLPPSSASLLLIPHRREPSSLAAAFDSHAFSSLQAPQIALVDAFRGAASSKVQIADRPLLSSKPSRVEDLRLNSVIALKPGRYSVMLAGRENQTLASAALEVGDRSKNVVMRVGSSDGGKSGGAADAAFPEELIVFSQRSSAEGQGGDLAAHSAAAAAARPGLLRHSSLLSVLVAGLVAQARS